MDKNFREKLKQLRFLYKYQIGKGLKTYLQYKAERRRIIKESREKEAIYWNDGFRTWMNLKLNQKQSRAFYKEIYEEALKKKKPQSKLDKFISQDE